MKRQDLEQQVNLLKRIVKDPNDVAVRLEYAEFLTKHGFDDEAFLHYNFSNPVEISKSWLNDIEAKIGLPKNRLIEEFATDSYNMDSTEHWFHMGNNETAGSELYKYHDDILHHLGVIYGKDFSKHSIWISCAC